MYGMQVNGSKWKKRKHKNDASRDRKDCDDRDEDTARCYMIAVGAYVGKGQRGVGNQWRGAGSTNNTEK